MTRQTCRAADVPAAKVVVDLDDNMYDPYWAVMWNGKACNPERFVVGRMYRGHSRDGQDDDSDQDD